MKLDISSIFPKVNHDFKKRYQNANDGLTSYWIDFFKSNMGELIEMINDPDINQTLRDINTLNGKHISLFVSFHYSSLPLF